MMTSKRTIDFTKVETLRKHMLLTRGDMAVIFGVSRITYGKWVAGAPIRTRNEATVRLRIREMLSVLDKHKWPQPPIIAMLSAQRLQTLLEYMRVPA